MDETGINFTRGGGGAYSGGVTRKMELEAMVPADWLAQAIAAWQRLAWVEAHPPDEAVLAALRGHGMPVGLAAARLRETGGGSD